MSRRLMLQHLQALAAVGCALVLSGCLMMKKDGDALRSAMDAQDKRLAQLEADVRAKNLELDAKLAELQQSVERTKGLLTRDSADVGQQVQAQEQRLATFEGKLDEFMYALTTLTQDSAKARVELTDKITKLESTAAAKPMAASAVDPSQIPEDKVAHFTAAYEAYRAGEHERARALWTEYLARYPADDKTGEAQYWIGASFLVQNKPATALGEYRKVIMGYPKSPAVDTALYGMADAFFRLRACTDAKDALAALQKRKPSKSLGGRAVELLKAITAAPEGHCSAPAKSVVTP